VNSASATERWDRDRSGFVPTPSIGARRGAARPAPERNPALAHLSLAELRAYRCALTGEEGKASYWRRVVQARIEVVAATDDSPVVDNLGDVLAGVPTRSTRAELLDVVAAGGLPELPDLTSVWLAEPTRGDRAGNAGLVAALTDAEERLGDYRDALEQRLATATAELIARYHEDPKACLVALPRQPGAPVEA
jgi:hypothetical protein